MISGKIINLNCFKSYEDKSKLLELSVTSHHSSTILNVILFIKDNLTPSLFIQIMSKYEEAICIYAKYLKERNSFSSLIMFYKSLNRVTEEAMSLLYAAYKVKEPLARLNAFKQCLELFSRTKTLEFQVEGIKEQILLMERQIPIEEHDSKAALSGNEVIFTKYPRSPIIYSPLSYTLWYSFFYHPTAPKDKLSSPYSIKAAFQITERRFIRSLVNARSKIGDWQSLKDSVSSKKSIFSKGPQSVIGFEPYAEAVYDNKGPEDILKYFLSLIESPVRKYILSVRYKQWDIAIESVATLKDREKANNLKSIIVNSMGAEASQVYREKLDALNFK